MKSLILFSILCAIPLIASSQDIIITNNGKSMPVKVLRIDSAYVYYDAGQDLSISRINRKDVESIRYGSKTSGVVANETRQINAVTIGVLEGGGSLLGIDYEVLLSQKVGLQIGAGFVGFGAGLNIHFLPTIRSSYLSLQYWHQGFRNSFTQSLIGPSLVFRGKKLFSGQIGIGFLADEGPARPEKIKDTTVMLTYAIGLYFPY